MCFTTNWINLNNVEKTKMENNYTVKSDSNFMVESMPGFFSNKFGSSFQSLVGSDLNFKRIFFLSKIGPGSSEVHINIYVFFQYK